MILNLRLFLLFLLARFTAGRPGSKLPDDIPLVVKKGQRHLGRFVQFPGQVIVNNHPVRRALAGIVESASGQSGIRFDLVINRGRSQAGVILLTFAFKPTRGQVGELAVGTVGFIKPAAALLVRYLM